MVKKHQPSNGADTFIGLLAWHQLAQLCAPDE
jgi:hypothetical protein